MVRGLVAGRRSATGPRGGGAGAGAGGRTGPEEVGRSTGTPTSARPGAGAVQVPSRDTGDGGGMSGAATGAGGAGIGDGGPNSPCCGPAAEPRARVTSQPVSGSSAPATSADRY